MPLSQITKVASRPGLASRLRTAEVGGFPPVRFRAGNLEGGRSVYGVGGPIAECPLWSAIMQFRTFLRRFIELIKLNFAR